MHKMKVLLGDKLFQMGSKLGPKRTWLNLNIRSNERTFECSLRNSNFAINSMRKCALISKVEKWHPHFREWLQMLPMQVIWVNLGP